MYLLNFKSDIKNVFRIGIYVFCLMNFYYVYWLIFVIFVFWVLINVFYIWEYIIFVISFVWYWIFFLFLVLEWMNDIEMNYIRVFGYRLELNVYFKLGYLECIKWFFLLLVCFI